MNATTRKSITTGAKVFVAAAVVLSAWSIVDFAFFGRHISDLLASTGFGLWAYGTYRNGNRRLPEAAQDQDFSKLAYRLSALGSILVIVAIALNLWP